MRDVAVSVREAVVFQREKNIDNGTLLAVWHAGENGQKFQAGGQPRNGTTLIRTAEEIGTTSTKEMPTANPLITLMRGA